VTALGSRLWSLGLVEPIDALDAGCAVWDVSGRNHVYLVDGPVRAAVKMPGTLGPPGALQRERDMLAWLSERHPGLGPRTLAWDPIEATLVSEWVEGPTLAASVRRIGDLPVTLAACVGDTLGALHAGVDPPQVAAQRPGVLRIHRPGPTALSDRTPAQLDLVRMVQRTLVACAALDDATVEWRDTSVIHADIRWDNVIVAELDNGGDVAVRLVDWELSGCGEPCWDIASAIACVLRDELAPIDRPGASAWDLTIGADCALMQARPAVFAMWTAWETRVDDQAVPLSDVRRRAMRLTGARLVQFADEMAVHAAHP